MLRLFLGNQFIANLLLPLFVVFYVLLNFGTNHLEIPALIDFGFWGKFHPIEPYLSSILSGSLILINAFTLNHLFNSNEFHDKNNFSIALFYVVFMSFFHSFYHSYQAIYLERNKLVNGRVFIADFIFACLFTIYKSTIYMENISGLYCL